MGVVTNDPAVTIGSTTALGGAFWQNPQNAAGGDGVATTASQASSTAWTSDPLSISNCALNLPAGAAVTGLAVAVVRQCSGGFVTDSSLKIVLNDGTTSRELAGAGAWPTAYGTASYGGPTDLCGFSPGALTVANLNGTGCGVTLAAQASGGFDQAIVDQIRLSVYYSGGTVPAVTAFPFLIAHL